MRTVANRCNVICRLNGGRIAIGDRRDMQPRIRLGIGLSLLFRRCLGLGPFPRRHGECDLFGDKHRRRRSHALGFVGNEDLRPARGARFRRDRVGLRFAEFNDDLVATAQIVEVGFPIDVEFKPELAVDDLRSRAAHARRRRSFEAFEVDRRFLRERNLELSFDQLCRVLDLARELELQARLVFALVHAHDKRALLLRNNGFRR